MFPKQADRNHLHHEHTFAPIETSWNVDQRYRDVVATTPKRRPWRTRFATAAELHSSTDHVHRSARGGVPDARSIDAVPGTCRTSRVRKRSECAPLVELASGLEWLFSELPRDTHPNIGQCSRCAHMRLIQSDRGATFYLCGMSKLDARFPKYPRLPVNDCSGFTDRSPWMSSH